MSLGAGVFALMGHGCHVIIEWGMACTCGSWGVGVVCTALQCGFGACRHGAGVVGHGVCTGESAMVGLKV
jgi:hypothetical protein